MERGMSRALREVYALSAAFGHCRLCSGDVGVKQWNNYCWKCLSTCAACGSPDIEERTDSLAPVVCAACHHADMMERCGDCGAYHNQCECLPFARAITPQQELGDVGTDDLSDLETKWRRIGEKQHADF